MTPSRVLAKDAVDRTYCPGPEDARDLASAVKEAAQGSSAQEVTVSFNGVSALSGAFVSRLLKDAAPTTIFPEDLDETDHAVFAVVAMDPDNPRFQGPEPRPIRPTAF